MDTYLHNILNIKISLSVTHFSLWCLNAEIQQALGFLTYQKNG